MSVGRRGIQKLFEDHREETEERDERADVLERRDKCVTSRAYYYLHLQKKNYEFTLDTLAKEFFLSTLTIGRIINGNLSKIRVLLNQQTTIEQLCEDWPHINWIA